MKYLKGFVLRYSSKCINKFTIFLKPLLKKKKVGRKFPKDSHDDEEEEGDNNTYGYDDNRGESKIRRQWQNYC